MKKIFFYLYIILTATTANATEIIELPQPDITQSTPTLLEIIDYRQSNRIFDNNKRVDDKTLSEILWSAFGYTSFGKRTIPTFNDKQDIKIYVIQNSGIWYYDAFKNNLQLVQQKNIIPHLSKKQKSLSDAPIHLIYTSSDNAWGKFHVGSASQNVYLYASAHEMNTVVLGIKKDNYLAKELHLLPNEHIIAYQPIGYGK